MWVWPGDRPHPSKQSQFLLLAFIAAAVWYYHLSINDSYLSLDCPKQSSSASASCEHACQYYPPRHNDAKKCKSSLKVPPNSSKSVLFFKKPSCNNDVIRCNRRWSKGSANSLSFNTCAWSSSYVELVYICNWSRNFLDR